MSPLKLLAAASIIAPVAAMAADSVQLTPGRWEEHLNMASATLGGRNLPVEGFPGQNKVVYSCVSQAEALDPSAYFMRHSPGDSCEPHGTVARGKISMTGHCTGKDLPMELAMEGAYGSQSYRLTATATTTLKAEPLVMNIVVDGHYVGACKGDEGKPG